MTNGEKDFREVAHCGGKIAFDVENDEQGERRYSIGFSGSFRHPAAFFGVYALPQGIACADIRLGGIGQRWNAPPFADCIPVLIGSDSEGRFGHQCTECGGYFRSSAVAGAAPMSCCYCGIHGSAYQFLTEAQQRYVQHYARELLTALSSDESPLKIEIDMDAIGDASVVSKPDFYYLGETQQTQFTCKYCNEWNDVKGVYAYCSICGSRNNLQKLSDDFEKLRGKLNERSEDAPSVLRLAVSAFDACCRDFVAQLCECVPQTTARRNTLKNLLFHGIDQQASELKSAFDIDILSGIDNKNQNFIHLMFCRRHAFEHDGGIATARYIQESGDNTVKENALIREKMENVHRLIGYLMKMVTNLHKGFHDIFPPEQKPIDLYQDTLRQSKLPRS